MHKRRYVKHWLRVFGNVLKCHRRRSNTTFFLVGSICFCLLYLMKPFLVIEFKNENYKQILQSNYESQVVNNISSQIEMTKTAEGICATRNSETDIYLLLAVKSYTGNFDQRLSIRKSWGNSSRRGIQTVFFVGNQTYVSDLLKYESALYSDIVQGRFRDHYNNNILKTIMMYKWIYRYCSTVQYILFVDDDFFVNIENIIQIIKQAQTLSTTNWAFGRECGSWCKPYRSKDSKWFVSKQEYSPNFWPNYLFGGSILTTFDVVKRFVNAVQYVRPVHIDDVYVGMVMKYLGVQIHHHDGFSFGTTSVHKLGRIATSHGYGERGKLIKTWSKLFSEGKS